MTIQEYIERLLALSSVDEVTVTTEETDGQVLVHLEIPEEDAGRVIGHRGEALAAIQRLVRVIFHEELEDTKLILDINDYRQKREEQLVDMAMNAAHKVLQTGHEHVFPYLPSYERFLIHSTISNHADFDELETVSHGEGRGRRLVVRFAEEGYDAADHYADQGDDSAKADEADEDKSDSEEN